MGKRRQEPAKLPDHVSWSDGYRIALSLLMFLLGGIILYHAVRDVHTVPAFLLGVALVVLGVVRVRAVVHFFRTRYNRK